MVTSPPVSHSPEEIDTGEGDGFGREELASLKHSIFHNNNTQTGREEGCRPLSNTSPSPLIIPEEKGLGDEVTNLSFPFYARLYF